MDRLYTNAQLGIGKVLLCLLISFSSLICKAQIQGISASKLISMSSDAIDKNTFEFEPAFGYLKYRKYWDEKGKLHDVPGDSVYYESELAFRFTYSVAEGLEIGATIPANVSRMYFGTKYCREFSDKFNAGLMAGVNLPVGTGGYHTTIRPYEQAQRLGVGLIFSYQPNYKLSFDANIELQEITGKTIEGYKESFMYKMDAGLFVNEWLQPVMAFSASHNHFDGYETNRFTFYTGCTIEPADNFLMVLTLPFDISGRNANKLSGFVFALTVSLQ